jgi:hypothetical protein
MIQGAFEESAGTNGRAAKQRTLASLDPKDLPTVAPLREGYPWLATPHRPYDWGVGPPSPIDSVGVRWQSVIVSPTRLPWMDVAPVGPDERFAWWQRLREVECSWLANRGESERFLYYDGPSVDRVPVSVVLEGETLIWSQAWSQKFADPAELPGAALATRTRRSALYVEVTGQGAAGLWLDVGDRMQSGVRDLSAWRRAPVGERDFEAELMRRGLTASEASGMSACWAKPFFHTPGRRFLFFMSEEEYRQICRVRVTPAPTESARLGVVWTEFIAK